jgi:hypothetical protein
MGNYKDLCQLSNKYIRRKYYKSVPYRKYADSTKNPSSIGEQHAVLSETEEISIATGSHAFSHNPTHNISTIQQAVLTETEELVITSDDDSTDSDDESESPQNFLRRWTAECDLFPSHLNPLLVYLRRFKDFESLPKDYRALLGTPRKIEIITVAPGTYIHIGLKVNLDRIIAAMPAIPKQISLDFNVDGASISDSSASTIWPILGRAIENSHHKLREPFVIGVYHGYRKPENFNLFLKSFVEETKSIMSDYSFQNERIKVNFRALICDAPARSAVAGVKQYNSTAGCSKCVIEGETLAGRTTFQENQCDWRTDYEFRAGLDEDHHNYTSVLENLDIDMIRQIPLDYMHLVCLGAVKNLIALWTKPKQGVIGASVITEISCLLNRISSVQPVEFQKRTKSFNHHTKLKACEYRTLILYTGPVIFEKYLTIEQYNHFLLLHVAITILVSKEYIGRYISVAESLLKAFHSDYGRIYGYQYVSYTVHSLTHLCDEAKIFGTLDDFSAFPYENHIYKIKKKIHNGKLPIQQLSNRLKEQISVPITLKATIDQQACKKIVKKDNLILTEKYYKIKLNKFVIDSNPRNSWFITKCKKIIHFDHAIKENDTLFVLGQQVAKVEMFYYIPVSSLKLDIYKGKRTNNFKDNMFKCTIEDIQSKVFAIPIENNTVFMPLRH